jgi:hypothetical protein
MFLRAELSLRGVSIKPLFSLCEARICRLVLAEAVRDEVEDSAGVLQDVIVAASVNMDWSGREESNLRPLVPKIGLASDASFGPVWIGLLARVPAGFCRECGNPCQFGIGKSKLYAIMRIF